MSDEQCYDAIISFLYAYESLDAQYQGQVNGIDQMIDLYEYFIRKHTSFEPYKHKLPDGLYVASDHTVGDDEFTYAICYVDSFNRNITSTAQITVKQHETVERGTQVVAPTCTNQGYTVHIMSDGNSYIDNVTPALGHNYVSKSYSYTTYKGGHNVSLRMLPDGTDVTGWQNYQIDDYIIEHGLPYSSADAHYGTKHIAGDKVTETVDFGDVCTRCGAMRWME